MPSFDKSYSLFPPDGKVNPDRLTMVRALVDKFARSGNREFHPGRDQVQNVIDIYRESNNAVARKYLSKDRLFDEDISNYPEKTASHGLTPLKCTEIAATLWQCGFDTKKY